MAGSAMIFISYDWKWDLALLSLIAVALFYYHITSMYTFWGRIGVAYRKPHMFYGNVKDVVQFKRTQFEVFEELYQFFKRSGHKFGGIFQLREPVLLICDTKLVKDLCVTNFPRFHDRPLIHNEEFDPLSAHLVSLGGHKWKFIRSKLSPAFSASKLKGMVPLMKELAEAFMLRLGEASERGEMVEMRKTFLRYMTDVIGSVAFGLDVHAQEKDSEFLHLGRTIFNPSQWERVKQLLLQTYPWVYKTFKIKTVPKKVTEFFMRVVKDVMQYRREHNVERNDFLHYLMRIKEERGTRLQDLEEMQGVNKYNMKVKENSIELTEGVIAAQAFVFFLAGYETSASTMSACVHVLAGRPEIQEKMLQEVNTALETFGDLTYEAIQSLTYVEQVLEETLRMYPPVGLILRKCTKPYRIPKTEIVVPRGCQIFIPVYSFHYDPHFFPNPKVFKPERFAPENRANLVPYSFMPFGQGPRVCIGQRMAMMEMKLTLALMVKNFEIVKCEKTTPYRINPKSFFMCPIDGLWVRLNKRQ